MNCCSFEGGEMKFLSGLVLILAVYSFSFLLFVSFRKERQSERSREFLQLSFMRTTPRRRRPFVFSMRPWRISSKSPRSPNLDANSPDVRWSVIVFVKSHSSHRSRRMLARMAWASFEFINGVRIEYIFVIGRPESAEEKENIEDENHKFGDLLQITLEEKYTSVGFKTLASMQYAETNFPPHWMYVSCDDDIAPDWVRMIEEFDSVRQVTEKSQKENACDLEGHMPIMCGFGAVNNALPQRQENSKWRIENMDYPLSVYPTYCMGGFYGMSVKLASELYEISQTLPFFWIDDVWVTGFLRLSRFFRHNSTCQTEVSGLWSTSQETFSSTGTEHELVTEWIKYVSKIFEKKHVYVDEQPTLHGWKAWLDDVLH